MTAETTRRVRAGGLFSPPGKILCTPMLLNFSGWHISPVKLKRIKRKVFETDRAELTMSVCECVSWTGGGVDGRDQVGGFVWDGVVR